MKTTVSVGWENNSACSIKKRITDKQMDVGDLTMQKKSTKKCV